MKKLCLRVETQPFGIFYKDEGGRSNYLTASISIDFENQTISRQPIGNLVVLPRLVFENGDYIDDEKEIFKVLSVDPKTMTSSKEIFTVQFRVEKVSRRKDGRKFKIRFEVSSDRSILLPGISPIVDPVETTSVTVLSKRKMSHAHSMPLNQQLVPGTNLSRKVMTAAGTGSTSGSVASRKRGNNFEEDSDSEESRTSFPGLANNKRKAMKSENIAVPLDVLLKVKQRLTTLEDRVHNLTERVHVLERDARDRDNISLRHQFDRKISIGTPEDLFNGSNGNNNNVIPTRTHVSAFQQRSGITRNNSSTEELLDFLNQGSFFSDHR